MHARFGLFLVGVLAAVSATAWGCGGSDSSTCVPKTIGSPFSVQLHVVDESGAPVAASYDTGSGPSPLGPSLSLPGPTFITLTADGFLKEPIALGPTDAGHDVTVRMWASKGGARVAIHSTGDVMLGRRYETPTSGDPLVPQMDPATGAHGVVQSVVGLMNASDARTINLETVVADVPDNASYPGKRYILRTRPGALAGISDLNPLAVSLANNHTRDFLDTGINDTLSSLDAANVKHLGALKDPNGEAPLVLPVGNLKVGLAAFTSVDGSFVNDSYPGPTDMEPMGTDPADSYEYTARMWGFTGQVFNVPNASRRIGPAWQIFSAAEPTLSPSDVLGGFSSLTTVYPEIQDWVARRGHGGANQWDDVASPSAIEALRAKSDIVIVQVHAGYQFEESPSANVETIVEAAIAAGADLVICHHPHIVQGLAFVKGKLVAYSMGNFVFDQDFLATYSSAVLRTVWEGNTMLEARLLPVEINAYKPAPSTGLGARVTLDRMWERGVLRAYTNRDSAGAVINQDSSIAPYITPAHFTYDRNSAILTPDAPTVQTSPLELPSGANLAVADTGLIDPRLGGAPAGVLVGRELFGWGRFESELADGQGAGDTHWSLNNRCDANTTTANGIGTLRLQRFPSDTDDLSIAPVSQIPLFHHRLYDQDGTPLDPPATYSIHLRAKLDVASPVKVDISLYHFDDTNPTEDPESTQVGQVELDMPVSVGGDFADVWTDLQPTDVGDSSPGNSLLVHIVLPQSSEVVHLDIDQFDLVEWRDASKMHDRFGRYDFVRNTTAKDVSLAIPFWPRTP